MIAADIFRFATDHTEAVSAAVHARQGRQPGVQVASFHRFAHDLAMSSFGMRQDIHEYWQGGDPSRNRINLLRAYDESNITDRIKAMGSQPLPHGEAS
jgi:aromatic ring hydroxylase